MKVHVTTTYECEVCHRHWETAKRAETCEHYPPPALVVDDVVIWTGMRDGGTFQTLVFDWVTGVSVDLIPGVPGHPATYVLAKQHTVRDHEVRDARTGYVNLATRVGLPILHSDRVEVAMRGIEDGMEAVIARLREAGVPLQQRTAALYRKLRDLQYSSTWSSASRPRTAALRVTAKQATVLRFISRELSDAECLAFVGGYAVGRRPAADLAGAFSYNEYHQEWSGLIGFNMNAAMELLTTSTEEEIIDRVRRYHAALLDGSALYPTSGTLERLFPVDEAHATGTWPAEPRAWARERRIAGSGATRLHRVAEAAYEAGEKTTVQANNELTIFDDRPVIAVCANKGGVGKSSIAAHLARALTAMGRRVLVLDADFHGPNQPDFFPVAEPRLRTHDRKIVPHLVDGVEVLSIGHLLRDDEALTWRGPYLEPVLHLLAANVASEADVVIVDMPPGTGDVMRGLTKLCPQARYLLVTTAARVALSDVRRAITALSGDERSRIIGVVENMAGWMERDAGKQYLWGGSPDAVPQMAAEYHLRFLGAVPMGTEDEARAAVAQVITPVVLEHLANPQAQIVDLELIVQAADTLIAEARTRDAEIHSLMHVVWSYDNIASFLEAPIRREGGDVNDPRYHQTLRRELQRVYAAIGTEPRSRDSTSPASWWANLVPQETVESGNHA